MYGEYNQKNKIDSEERKKNNKIVSYLHFQLPDDLPFETLLVEAKNLYRKYPPESISNDVRDYDYKRKIKEQEWKAKAEANRQERERQ
ncbi:hypothetical protein EUZ93_01540 [Wolbachia pipientis]|nr:hypothetical protein [Wolbachia pipientis]